MAPQSDTGLALRDFIALLASSFCSRLCRRRKRRGLIGSRRRGGREREGRDGRQEREERVPLTRVALPLVSVGVGLAREL